MKIKERENYLFKSADELIKKYKLVRVYALVETAEFVSVTLHNLWRITRFKDDETWALQFEEFSFKTQKWHKLDYCSESEKFTYTKLGRYKDKAYFPDFKIFNVQGKTVYNFLNRIIEKVFAFIYQQQKLSFTSEKKNDLKHKVEGRLISKFKHIFGENDNSLTKAFLKILWGNFINRPFFGAIKSIQLCKVYYLTDYLEKLANFKAIIKISNENHNLIPLIPYIKDTYMGKDALFSYKYWVRQENKRCYSRIFRKGSKISFTQKSQYKFLKKLSIQTVMYWTRTNCNVPILDILSKVPLNIKKIPVYIISSIFSKYQRILNYNVPQQQLVTLLTLYINKCFEVKKSHSENPRFLRIIFWRSFHGQACEQDTIKFAYLLDWLQAEGYEQGYPRKGNTWNNLLALSDAWHERIIVEAQERTRLEQKKRAKMKWKSSVPKEMLIDSVTITSLNSANELDAEGLAMHHCVGSYSRHCLACEQRIFSLQSDEGKSTLAIIKSQNEWRVSQLRAACNGMATEQHMGVAQKIAQIYTQKTCKIKEKV